MISIDQTEVEHARFNAGKTFSTTTPSQFEHARFGDLIATRDPARPDSYYHRVLGVVHDSLHDLDQALSWITKASAPDQSIRLDIGADDTLVATLDKRGFRQIDSLVWLQAGPTTPLTRSATRTAPDVRALTTADWAPLRQLLEAHGPITDAVWRAKRAFLCTDTFRWVGIFDGEELVSAASTWATTNVSILGSAYTKPAWRNRGYQRQLLAYRRDAATTQLFVDVAPGSTSYRNCTHAGFLDLEHRYVLERTMSR